MATERGEIEKPVRRRHIVSMNQTMSLDLEGLRIFAKVAELGSFTRAGDQLGMPKARVSLRVQKLERELGSRLLQRTTRRVQTTEEGQLLLLRARPLLVEAEQVSTMFQAARSLRGSVRMDLPVTFAREVIIPRLPELISRHPDLELVVSATDRRVDARREGFDVVLRVGAVGDTSLVGSRQGVLRMMNYASPSYLRAHGMPLQLADLDRHHLVHYSSMLGAERPAFEYPHGSGYREKPMRSWVTVNNTDANAAACAAGLGIIQVPRVGAGSPSRAGLVEVLPELTCAPMPVTLLHTHSRNPPRRVRAVLSWLSEMIKPHLATRG
jgi:DNA-binding transcriptional LysR family regulator